MLNVLLILTDGDTLNVSGSNKEIPSKNQYSDSKLARRWPLPFCTNSGELLKTDLGDLISDQVRSHFRFRVPVCVMFRVLEFSTML